MWWYQQCKHESFTTSDSLYAITIDKTKAILINRIDFNVLMKSRVSLNAEDASKAQKDSTLNTRGGNSSNGMKIDYNIVIRRYLFCNKINSFEYGIWLKHNEIDKRYHQLFHNIADQIPSSCDLLPIQKYEQQYTHKSKLYRAEKDEHNGLGNGKSNNKCLKGSKVIFFLAMVPKSW